MSKHAFWSSNKNGEPKSAGEIKGPGFVVTKSANTCALLAIHLFLTGQHAPYSFTAFLFRFLELDYKYNKSHFLARHTVVF